MERRRSGAFVINTEHITSFFSVPVVDFEQANVHQIYMKQQVE